jgi:HK97 family phage major capsid protein
VDRINECLAAMWVQGFIGNVILMNPFDLVDIETERSPDDGHYVVGGGPFSPGPNPPTIWRTPVARTAALAQGECLVCDSRYIWLLDRESTTVMVSNEHSDNLTRNLVTCLVEMRGSLAVLNTSAINKVDLAST